MKHWLPLGNEEHKLTRKGIDNLLFTQLQLLKLKVGQSPTSANFTGTHLYSLTPLGMDYGCLHSPVELDSCNGTCYTLIWLL